MAYNKPVLDSKKVTTQLRSIRKTYGYLQAQVADKADLSREALLRAESGTSDIRLSSLEKWAAALGYKVSLTPMTDEEKAAAFSLPTSSVKAPSIPVVSHPQQEGSNAAPIR